MTPPPKREEPQETTPEDLARWERYGLLVQAVQGYWSGYDEDRRWSVLDAEGLDALDALADILTEHCRLRAYADPFLTSDPDD